MRGIPLQNNFLTLYQNVLNDLILKIESNELQLGVKLPSEQQLCESYGVSRITIRRALQELETRGYIIKRQGKGSYVADQVADSELFKDVDIEAAIKRMNLTAKIKLVKFDLVVDGQKDEVERRLLNLASDDYFYQLQYKYYGDGELMAFQKVSILFDQFPLIRVSEIKDKSLYPMLAKKYGFSNVDFVQETTTGLVTNKERKFLEINTGSPFVKIEKQGISEHRTVLFDEIYMIDSLPMYLIDN